MTRDHDRKDLVRERMAKTGESYATAHRHLFGSAAEPATEQPTPDTAGVFELPSVAPDALGQPTLGLLVSQAEVRIVEGRLTVQLGNPAVFQVAVPLHMITKVERVPDHSVGPSRGVHGGFGKWLVNSTDTGLVQLTLSGQVQADLKVRASVPEGTREATPRFLRPLLRDRRPKVRQLTISLVDPDRFLSELGAV